MTDTTLSLAAALLAVTLAACSGGSPSAPSPGPQPLPSPTPPTPPATLVTFTAPGSTFSTTDVRDQQDEIVRFNTIGELIWTADDTRFSGYPVSGNFIGSHGYEVVFVSRDGERRAYLTVHGHGPTDPNRVCDITVVNDQVVITESNIPLCSPHSSGPC